MSRETQKTAVLFLLNIRHTEFVHYVIWHTLHPLLARERARLQASRPKRTLRVRKRLSNILFTFKTWNWQSVFSIIFKNANFLPQDTIFCPLEKKFVAGQLIIKQALPTFASAWLPPWPVRRACKSKHVSLCEWTTREGLWDRGMLPVGENWVAAMKFEIPGFYSSEPFF